ncbi:hypothetical protein OED52_07075 [Rhodococcus sp. Z13]|uniref:Uncharacterized protein n=1 Tax=Rhodococcus sacchari TaxID=2962047 RepID=A0ACD4DJP8_9NOCA|nr:hypothetical protein [Rhodococcus sp. Z13]UYP20289.1 hypothetical protein OED52_07075 [Rhodococcus sp. Z13]
MTNRLVRRLRTLLGHGPASVSAGRTAAVSAGRTATVSAGRTATVSTTDAAALYAIRLST